VYNLFSQLLLNSLQNTSNLFLLMLT
jgi:hypothetical protein